MHPFIYASIPSFAHSFVQAFMHSLVTCIHLFLIPCFLLTLYWSDCQSKLHQAHISKTNQIKQWQSWGIDQSNLKGQLAWEWVCSGRKKNKVFEVTTVYAPLVNFSVWTCSFYLVLLGILAIINYRVFIFPYGNTLILSLVQHTADMKGQLLSNKVTWKWKNMRKSCFNTVGRISKGWTFIATFVYQSSGVLNHLLKVNQLKSREVSQQNKDGFLQDPPNIRFPLTWQVAQVVVNICAYLMQQGHNGRRASSSSAA